MVEGNEPLYVQMVAMPKATILCMWLARHTHVNLVQPMTEISSIYYILYWHTGMRLLVLWVNAWEHDI